MSVVGIFSSTINNTNTKTCCYMKCKCQIKHIYKILERTLNTNSKFTQGCVPNTHAHLFKSSCIHTKNDGVQTRVLAFEHELYYPSACCGLDSIGSFTPPSLPSQSSVYLPFLCVSTNNSKYLLQDRIHRKCISGMCAVILTCSVVHIVHSIHN